MQLFDIYLKNNHGAAIKIEIEMEKCLAIASRKKLK